MPQAPLSVAPAVSGRAANAAPKLSITNGLSGAAAIQDPVTGGEGAGGVYAAAAARRRSSTAHSTATATSAASDKQSLASAHSTPAAVPQSSVEVGLVCGSIMGVPASAAASNQDGPTVTRPDAYSTPDAAAGALAGPTPTTPSTPLSPYQPRNRPSSRNPNFRGHRHLRKKSAAGGRNSRASGQGAGMDSNGIQAIYGAGAAADRGHSHNPSPKRRPASVSASRRRRTRSQARSHSRSQSSASHAPADTQVDGSSPSGARLLAHAEGEWQDSLRGGPTSPGSESRASQRSRARPASSSQRRRRGFSQNPTYSAPRQGRSNTRPHSRGSSADPSARRPSSSAAARVSARDRVARRQRAMMEHQRERHQIGLVMDPRDEVTAQRSGHRPRTPVSVSDLPNSGGLTTGALGDQLRAAHAAVRRPDMQQQRQMRNSPAKRVHQVPNRPAGSAQGRRRAGVPAASPQGMRGGRGRPLGFMHGRRLRTAAPAVQEAKQAAGRGSHARPPASSVDDVLSVDELPDYPDFEQQLEALNAAAIADQAAGSGANAVRATLRHSADPALGSGGVEGGKQDGVSIVGLLQPNPVANPTATATATVTPATATAAGGPVVRSAAGIRSLKPPSVVEASIDTHQATTVPQQQHKPVVRSAAGIRSLKPPSVVEDTPASSQPVHAAPQPEQAAPVVEVTRISEQVAGVGPLAPAQSSTMEPTGAAQPAPASAAPLAVVPETAVAVQPAPASTVPAAASAADTVDCPRTPPAAQGRDNSAGNVHASDALEVTIDDLQRMPSDSPPSHLPPTRSGSEDAEDESGAYISASSTSAGSRSTRRSGVEANSPMGQGMDGHHDSDRDVLHTPERPDSDKTDVAVATSPAATTASGMPAAVAVTTAADTEKSTGDCDKASAKVSALRRPEGDSIVIVHSTRDRGSKADEVMHATPVQSTVSIAGTVHSLPMHAH